MILWNRPSYFHDLLPPLQKKGEGRCVVLKIIYITIKRSAVKRNLSLFAIPLDNQINVHVSILLFQKEESCALAFLPKETIIY
ncbi:MAG: hypothetical protein D3916_04145 [Candidatus Electrothrix sp. MAN1_4]|nr:hypothetical protein [Candidatus Electrothrix sp. MAN1_4]